MVTLLAWLTKPIQWEIERRSCPHCHRFFAYYFRIPTSLRQIIDGGWRCKTCGHYFRPRFSLGSLLAMIFMMTSYGYEAGVWGAKWQATWIEVIGGWAIVIVLLTLLHSDFFKRGPGALQGIANRPALWIFFAWAVWHELVRIHGAWAIHGADAEIFYNPTIKNGIEFGGVMIPFCGGVPPLVGLPPFPSDRVHYAKFATLVGAVPPCQPLWGA